MNYFLFGAVVFGLLGCDSRATVDENTLMHTDFESLMGWLPDTQTALLGREQAHSGTYSLKVDPQHPYSLTYRAVLGTLHDTRIRKIRLSAWVFVPDAQAQATLVVTINDRSEQPKDVFWNGTVLQEAVAGQYGRWVEISKELELPEEANSSHELTVYLWRTGGDNAVFLDDLTMQNITSAK